MSSYPEWTAGYIDLAPGDDYGVFDGFCRDVDTKESSVTIVCNLDVNRVTFRVLKKNKSAQSNTKAIQEKKSGFMAPRFVLLRNEGTHMENGK